MGWETYAHENLNFRANTPTPLLPQSGVQRGGHIYWEATVFQYSTRPHNQHLTSSRNTTWNSQVPCTTLYWSTLNTIHTAIKLSQVCKSWCRIISILSLQKLHYASHTAPACSHPEDVYHIALTCCCIYFTSGPSH